MLFGGRTKLNKAYPNRTSNLGRWGVPCNLISLFFVVQSCVIYCFPATLVSLSWALRRLVADEAQPVSPLNMSYGKY
jgi:hypothetical protein